MVLKRIPYGISNYKDLVEENYIYVDKTSFIERLENYHSPYIFFLRPRRFGKSLFTSVLSNYYDILEKDNFEKLFGNTYIGKNPTKKHNSYCILKFNFSSISTETKESLENSFINITRIAFDSFINSYNLDIDYLKEGTAANIFEDFLSKVSMKTSTPLYVIIDEYDHFANSLLSFKTELFSDTISKTGFVRNWYETLKKGSETIVKKIFATGVSPITLDSLTSGFNIHDNITRLEEFNEMMGFTDDEVRNLIIASCNFQLTEDELNTLLDTLRKNYNGYLFSSKGKNRLFNSDMILYYLKSYARAKEAPESLIDDNIASDYGKLGKMFELKNKASNFQVLDHILKGEEIVCRVTNQFSLEKYFDADDFKSLLFYLGLLTIDSSMLGRVKLKVPNYAIKGLYFDYFLKTLQESLDYEINTSDIEESIFEIATNGKNTKLVTILEKTLNKLSNRDYINFDEKYIKMLLFAYCILSRVYLVKSEYEVENGFIDIALLKREPITPDYFGIFELKYITKSDYEKYGDSLLEKKKGEAIEQLEKYSSSEELMSLPNLKKWALVFVNDKCAINIEL